MAYGRSIWRTANKHPILGAATGYLVTRKALKGSLWGQLLVLGGLANWLDDKEGADKKAQTQKLIDDSKLAADAAVAEVEANAKVPRPVPFGLGTPPSHPVPFGLGTPPASPVPFGHRAPPPSPVPLGHTPPPRTEAKAAATEAGGDTALAFANETQTARNLALEQCKFWEYLLVEELLKSKLQVLRNQYDDFERTFTSVPKRPCSGAEFVKWVTYKANTLAATISRISSCISVDLIDAMGKPGVSGDAIEILDDVNVFFGHCRSFLDFELDLFAMDPPANMMALRDDFRGITSWVIDFVERFTDEWSGAVEEIRKGSHKFNVKVKLLVPPQVVKAKTEMEKISKHPEQYR